MSIFERLSSTAYYKRYDSTRIIEGLLFLMAPINFPSPEMKEAVVLKMGLGTLDAASMVKYDKVIISELNDRRRSIVEEMLSSECCIHFDENSRRMGFAISKLPPYLDSNGSLMEWYLKVTRSSEKDELVESWKGGYIDTSVFSRVATSDEHIALIAEILSKSENIELSSIDKFKYMEDTDFAVRYVDLLFSVSGKKHMDITNREADILHVVESSISLQIARRL